MLPAADEEYVKLYFLSAGVPLLDMDYRPGVDISDCLRMVRKGGDYVGDPCKIIVVSYLKRYEEHTRVVPLDLYGVDEDLLRVLDQHWESRKVMNSERVSFL